VDAEQLAAALAALNGYSTPRRRSTLVLAAVGEAGHVAHYLAVPAMRSAGTRAQLEAAIPGLTAVPIDRPPTFSADRVWRGWISTRQRPLDTRHPIVVARGLLTALARAEHDETLVMRWALGPVRRPASTRRRAGFDDYGLGLPDWAREALNGPNTVDDPEARTALAQKQGRPGWRAAFHLGARATGRRRQRQLLGALAGAARVAQAPGAQIGFKPSTRPAFRTALPRRRPLLVNVDELVGLSAWPLGMTEDLPVERERSRLLAPTAPLTGAGRVVAEATYPSAERPLGLSSADALQHLHVIGPTGTGKTTLLLHLICQDMAAGRSVVVIEPRGDLIADVLARVPDHRVDDVVVIDPTDPAPVGINPLATPGVPAELRVDHILAVFKRLWADNWGPRTQDILTSGLLTLAATPGMSLAALPILFTNDEFRASLVHRVDDPLALGPFWHWFNSLQPTERANVLAPVMNKVRVFLLRERLRRVVGQPTPRFALADIYRRRTVLLVNLSAGALGPESSALLGALIVSQLWQTVMARGQVAPQRRHPIMVFVDEFQNYLHLPTDLADVLAQARGFGVGLTLAHQHLAQLQPAIRAAVLANARSRVVFATNHDDADVLVRNTTRIAASDVVGLGRYAIYASLLTNGEATWVSGRTLPPPPETRPSGDLRQRSRDRWGVPATAIDAELAALAGSQATGEHARQPEGDATTLGTIILDDRRETER
jgi:hypothetical protein